MFCEVDRLATGGADPLFLQIESFREYSDKDPYPEGSPYPIESKHEFRVRPGKGVTAPHQDQ